MFSVPKPPPFMPTYSKINKWREVHNVIISWKPLCESQHFFFSIEFLILPLTYTCSCNSFCQYELWHWPVCNGLAFQLHPSSIVMTSRHQLGSKDLELINLLNLALQSLLKTIMFSGQRFHCGEGILKENSTLSMKSDMHEWCSDILMMQVVIHCRW